jgi:superfamily II DNA or RNA helicase
MGLYRQMIGRVLRPAPGKSNAIVLDHSGAVFRHGLPEDRVHWTLDPDSHAHSPVHQARLQRTAGRLIECSECSALRVSGARCPPCGFQPQRAAQFQPTTDGELGLVKGARAQASLYDPIERARWHGMLVTIAQQRGYKAGWAAANYREKFGQWPPYGAIVQPLPPSPECLSWVRSRTIAYARAMSSRR